MVKRPVTRSNTPKKRGRDEDDDYKKYKSYIKSKKWKMLCLHLYEEVFEKRCYCCGRREGDDGVTIALHHSTYEHLYDEENHPHDLIPLCNICHYAIHRTRSNWKRFSLRKNKKK